MAASTAELRCFGRVYDEEITEVARPVFHCDGHNRDHDDDLLPFFHSESGT